MKDFNFLTDIKLIFSKLKAALKVFAAFLICLTAFNLSSCNMLTEDKITSAGNKNGLVKINFGISDFMSSEKKSSDRSIAAPEALKENEIEKIILSGTLSEPAVGIEEQYTSISFDGTSAEFSTFEAVVAGGSWSFTLSAYSQFDGKTVKVAEASKNMKITTETEKIQFNLSYLKEGNGRFVYEINFPNKLSDEKFSKMEFKVYGDSLSAPVDSLTAAITGEIESVSFGNSIAGGYYLGRLLFYNPSNDCICTKSFYFKVAPGRQTSSSLEYAADELNTPYSISYVMKTPGNNIADFKDSADVVLEYNIYQTVMLPEKRDIVNKNYDFVGWYLTENCSGSAISAWYAHEKTGDITLYAKWTEKNRSFYVSATGTDSEDVYGTQTDPFATLQYAYERILADDGYDSTVSVDDQPLYTIYVMSNLQKTDTEEKCMHMFKIETADPIKLKIASSESGVKRTISMADGAAGRFMKFNDTSVKHSIDLTLEDLTFKDGNVSGDGGAVYLLHVKANLKNCSFENNHSDNNGGGLFSSGAILSIENCEFTGNSAKDGTDPVKTRCGGAIYLSIGNLGEIKAKINGIKLSGNTADEQGNGLYVRSTGVEIELGEKSIDVVSDDIYVRRFSSFNLVVSSAVTAADESIKIISEETISVGETIIKGSDTYNLTEADVNKFTLESAAGKSFKLSLDSTKNVAVAVMDDPYVRYVSMTGDDDTGDGSYTKPYLHLRKALQDFIDGEEPTATNDDGSFKNTVYILSDYTIPGGIGVGDEVYANIESAKSDETNAVLECNITDIGDDGNTVSAFWISGGQKFKVKNVDFTSTIKTSSYSLIGLTGGAELIMEGCSISGIETSRDVSAIYCEGSKLTLRNTSITNNIATDDDGSGWAYAVYVKKSDDGTEGELCVDGTVVISGNKKATSSASANLYLGDGMGSSLSYTPVKVLGDLTDSDIHLAIVTGTGNITEGYSTSGNTAAPSEIFKSDEGYSVKLNGDGEAYLKTTGGSVSVQLPDPSLSITCYPSEIVEDGDVTVHLLRNGTEEITEDVKYSLELFYNGVSTGLRSESNEIEIPPGSITGVTYTLSAVICYGGAYYSAEFEIRVEE